MNSKRIDRFVGVIESLWNSRFLFNCLVAGILIGLLEIPLGFVVVVVVLFYVLKVMSIGGLKSPAFVKTTLLFSVCIAIVIFLDVKLTDLHIVMRNTEDVADSAEDQSERNSRSIEDIESRLDTVEDRYSY